VQKIRDALGRITTDGIFTTRKTWLDPVDRQDGVSFRYGRQCLLSRYLTKTILCRPPRYWYVTPRYQSRWRLRITHKSLQYIHGRGESRYLDYSHRAHAHIRSVWRNMGCKQVLVLHYCPSGREASYHRNQSHFRQTHHLYVHLFGLWARISFNGMHDMFGLRASIQLRRFPLLQIGGSPRSENSTTIYQDAQRSLYLLRGYRKQ
jgi:hypothetical protein